MKLRLATKKVSKMLRKMIIFMVLIALAPLIIAAMSIRTFNTLHQQEVEERQTDVLDKIESDITTSMSAIVFALTPQYNKTIDRLATRRGDDIIYDQIPQETLDALAERLSESVAGAKIIDIVDASSGLVIAAASQDLPQTAAVEKYRDLSKLSIVSHALSSGEPRISPLRSTESGPQITIATPIKSLDDITPGLILATINLKELLAQIVAQNKIVRAGYIYLIDHDGRMLIHSELPNAAPISVSSVDLVGGLLFQGNIKTEGQKRYTSFWNEEVIGSGRMMALAGMEEPLGVIVELSAVDADFIVLQLIEQFSVISLLVLFLAGLLSVYLTLTIITPLSELRRGTERVESGHFDEPVNVKTGDELEDLGTSFNKMMSGLKRLEELRKEFVFVAAHELRTPVAAIKGYMELVLEKFTGDERSKDFLTKASAANERLIHLVDDLLEVARDEAGRIQIKVDPIEIVQPIEQILTELKPLADEKNIALEYTHGVLPQVLADKTRIKEVMVNLVGNSIKYSEKGPITITHEVKDGTLITRIKDSGYGISKEAQKKLFEKFYRVQTAQTREIKGTGLGLFIVKTIIEKMGGTIRVESEEGKGSTFSFALPLAGAPPIAPKSGPAKPDTLV